MTSLERFSFFIGKSSVFAVFEKPLYKEKLFIYLKSHIYDSFFFSCSLQLDFSKYRLLLSQFSSFKCANINLAIACKHPWISEKLGIYHLQPYSRHVEELGLFHKFGSFTVTFLIFGLNTESIILLFTASSESWNMKINSFFWIRSHDSC